MVDLQIQKLREVVVAELAAATVPRGKELEKYLSDARLMRFLDEGRGEWEEAAADLIDSWHFRQEWMPREILCPLCTRDPGAHSMRPVGFDAKGRLLLFVGFASSPGRFDNEATFAHLLRLLEDAEALLDDQKDGPRQIVCFIDFLGFGFADCDNQSLIPSSFLGSMQGQMLRLMKAYPSLLAQLILFDCGSFFEGLWHLLKPVIRDDLLNKVIFLSADQLLNFAESLRGTPDQAGPSSEIDCPELQQLGSDMVEWLAMEICAERCSGAGEHCWWEGNKDGSAVDPRGLKDFLCSRGCGYFAPYGNPKLTSTAKTRTIEVLVKELFQGRLGIRLKGLAVSGFDEAQAAETWCIADEIVKVCDTVVQTQQEFAAALKSQSVLKHLPASFTVQRLVDAKPKPPAERCASSAESLPSPTCSPVVAVDKIRRVG